MEGDSPRHRERRACLAQWNKISTPAGQMVVALRKRAAVGVAAALTTAVVSEALAAALVGKRQRLLTTGTK